MVTKGNYSFEDYEEMSYNAEYDMWGVYGVYVYENGVEIGHLDFVTESEINEMFYHEVIELMDEQLKVAY